MNNNEWVSRLNIEDLYKRGTELENGTARFVYHAPEISEPFAQNVSLGYKFATEHRVRCGKRFIKIKRFGKTRRYWVSKFMMTSTLTLNDKWITNLGVDTE
jgi:hypothetical protein